MNTNVYFLHQIYHNKTTNTWSKGIVIKDSTTSDNWDAVRQSYHAYLGAYAYGNNPDIDFVQCEITDVNNLRLNWENWFIPQQEEEPPVDVLEGEA